MQTLHADAGKNQFGPEVTAPGISLSESWRSAFGRLTAGCLGDSRAVIVIGERGVGKAALIDAWRDVSGAAFHIVTLKDATGEPDQVVADLANLMGVDTADMGRAAIVSAITASVREMRDSGKETVIVLENADKVPANTVELLMILSRDRGSQKPLLRFVITGTEKIRKVMRLDGGSVRRQSYTVVEMGLFTPEETRAFAVANLAQMSGRTITYDAATYLHESTSGKPANILTVLDKVSRGRMAEGEVEMTRAHIQSLVKAPDGGASATSANGAAGVDGPVAVPDDQPALAADAGTEGTDAPEDNENVFASNGQLPNSIGNVEDPRELLRWAFGLEGHSETEELTRRAEEKAAARAKAQAQEKSPVDINAALARVAERERAERGEVGFAESAAGGLSDAAADTAPDAAPVGEGTLDHMIQSEAFAFEGEKAPRLSPLDNPNDLKVALKDAAPVKSGRGKKLMLAAGVAAMGVAALGLLWTGLQPGGGLAPGQPQEGGTQTASIATAPAETQSSSTSALESTVASGAPSETDADGAEPDLASVIAAMKLPVGETGALGSDTSLSDFSDRVPSLTQAAYLPPLATGASQENLGLRQAIVADMAEAERTELASEEQRLMERLEALSAQVSQKETTLSSLERAITTISSQTAESGNLLDSRSAELEVMNSRLAFVARDRAEAVGRLQSATAEAEAVEARLQTMREELATAEALIAQNKAQLEQSQLAASNQGTEVAAREADFAELNRKIAEAENLLDTRRTELADLLSQKQSAETELSDLQASLDSAKTAQADVQAELVTLTAERDAQLEASKALLEQVETADSRLAAAQSDLQDATTQLKDRNAALLSIEEKTAETEARLARLVGELDMRKGMVSQVNSDLETLQAQRDGLQGSLADTSQQIAAATAELNRLEADQQTATKAFQDLQAKRDALEENLSTEEVVLQGLTLEADRKRTQLESLASFLADGRAEIEEQRLELAALGTQTETVRAAQDDAAAVVAEEQTEVETARAALAALSTQQESASAALAEAEEKTAEAKENLQTVVENKLAAEAEFAEATARLSTLKDQEAGAQNSLEQFVAQLDVKKGELSDLEVRISASNQDLQRALEKRDEINSQLTALTNEGAEKLKAQQALLLGVEAQLQQKQEQLAGLTREIETQQSAPVATEDAARVASLESAVVPAIRVRPAAATQEPEVRQPQVAVSQEPVVETGVGLSPRDADLVRTALADAPGLGRAPQDKKDELQAALVRGECVTDALKATFGRVNPHTLVALLENMEMCGS